MLAKPLHVRVAEALGCKTEAKLNRPKTDEWFWPCDCKDQEHGTPYHGVDCEFDDEEWRGGIIARYDTDWAATGPLIEKYGITLSETDGSWHACEKGAHAGIELTSEGWHDGKAAEGPTPLVAVCLLILALHAS